MGEFFNPESDGGDKGREQDNGSLNHKHNWEVIGKSLCGHPTDLHHFFLELLRGLLPANMRKAWCWLRGASVVDAHEIRCSS